jgi:hypothetical protein
MKEEEVSALIEKVKRLTDLEVDDVIIRVGAAYTYTSPIPAGCIGRRYKVHKFCLSVPSYQIQVLVEAMDGKDKGLSFVCSPANFALRYAPIGTVLEGTPEPKPSTDKPEPNPEPKPSTDKTEDKPGWVAGRVTLGSGN